MDLNALFQLIQSHPWATLGGGALFLSVVIYLIGVFLPGVVVGWVHRFFAAAKASPWWRDPAHPKRARWLLATAELAEDEIPEPGTGSVVYAAWGAKTAALTPLLMGTAGRWSAAYEKVGDAVDLELDAQVKDLATPPCPVEAPVAPPAAPAAPVAPPPALPAPEAPAAPAEPPAAPAPPEA